MGLFLQVQYPPTVIDFSGSGYGFTWIKTPGQQSAPVSDLPGK